MKLRIGHLYPDYLNIYADRGNIAVLARRAAGAGLELEVSAIGIGETRSGRGARPLLRRRRPGPRAGPDRARPRREGRRRFARRSPAAPRCSPSAAATSSSAASTATATAASCPARASSRCTRSRASARMIGDVLLECELEPGERADARRVREPRRPHDPRRRRRAARPRGRRLRQRRRRAATRAAGSAARSARTCTGRCCRATRGSPTGCSRRRSAHRTGGEPPVFEPLDDELEAAGARGLPRGRGPRRPF